MRNCLNHKNISNMFSLLPPVFEWGFKQGAGWLLLGSLHLPHKDRVSGMLTIVQYQLWKLFIEGNSGLHCGQWSPSCCATPSPPFQVSPNLIDWRNQLYVPSLGRQWVSDWLTATSEFGHKEWLLRLKTLQTFDQSDVQTKRQKLNTVW